MAPQQTQTACLPGMVKVTGHEKKGWKQITSLFSNFKFGGVLGTFLLETT